MCAHLPSDGGRDITCNFANQRLYIEKFLAQRMLFFIAFMLYMTRLHKRPTIFVILYMERRFHISSFHRVYYVYTVAYAALSYLFGSLSRPPFVGHVLFSAIDAKDS